MTTLFRIFAQGCCSLFVLFLVANFFVFRLFLINKLDFTPVSLSNKTIIVTGATDGIGKETANILAAWGANLVMPVRNHVKGRKVKTEILDSIKPNKVNIAVIGDVDFTDLSSVRRFAKMMEGRPVHALINNVGTVETTLVTTVDGNEKNFQVNYLASYLLTELLLPSLRLANQSRVVFVAGASQYLGTIVDKRRYSRQVRGLVSANDSLLQSLSDVKLMMTMSAMTFAEKHPKTTTFNALHPGFVMSNLDSNFPEPYASIGRTMRRWLARTTEQGAMTPVTLATHPRLDGVTGRYFSDYCMNTLCDKDCFYCDKVNPPGVVPSSEATNGELREWLWKETRAILGIE